MSQSITLRQLCAKLEISRRTLQGYEKAGLVKASGRNKYGHLLYDEETQKTIAEIRLYQKMGFPVKQINTIRSQSSQFTVKQLKEKIIALNAEKQEIDSLIKEAQKLIQKIERGENV